MGFGFTKKVNFFFQHNLKKNLLFFIFLFRLRAAKILLCGLNGLGAEVAKNIILSGVKSVTFLDDTLVTEIDSTSQFLAPTTSLGENRAQASFTRAQNLNPMVEVKIDTDKLGEKPDIFFSEFDVVLIIEGSLKELIRVNNACRLAGVKFFSGDVWGMFGYSFADLQEHNFVEDVVKHKIISKPNEKTKTELITSTAKRTILFTPFQDTLEFDFKTPAFLKKIKRAGPAYIVLRILQKFREQEKRDPCYKNRAEDLIKLKSIRDEIAGLELVPDSSFIHVFAQISPAVAIVGGELAQEVIKTVSQKEAPHNNLFLFDPERSCGFIETISV